MPNVDDLELDFAKGNGRVTVVTQDAASGAVLMVAHADRDAVERSVSSGEMHYFSRTRGLWHKGATSGNTQRLIAFARGDRCQNQQSEGTNGRCSAIHSCDARSLAAPSLFLMADSRVPADGGWLMAVVHGALPIGLADAVAAACGWVRGCCC